jgi:hypothetical protein
MGDGGTVERPLTLYVRKRLMPKRLLRKAAAEMAGRGVAAGQTGRASSAVAERMGPYTPGEHTCACSDV